MSSQEPPSRKRRRTRAHTNDGPGSLQLPKRAASSRSLTDLPVELLHTILIVSANSELVLINRYLHSVCSHAPPNVRAAYILSHLWCILAEVIIRRPKVGSQAGRPKQAAEAPSSSTRTKHPLHEPAFQRTLRHHFLGCVFPPRLIDARELVACHNLSSGPWWDEADLLDTDWHPHPRLLSSPLQFALRYPMCTLPTIDAFTSMLGTIPTFMSLATASMCNDRLTMRAIPRHVVRRLASSTSDLASPAAQRPDGATTSSSLFDLVSRLGVDGPKKTRPSQEALHLFLRLLFWHLDSAIEMVSPRRTSKHGVEGPEIDPAPLLRRRQPSTRLDPGEPSSYTDIAQAEPPQRAAASFGLELPRFPLPDEALLQAVHDENVWAVRLLRRFPRTPSKRRPSFPTAPTATPIPDAPPAFDLNFTFDFDVDEEEAASDDANGLPAPTAHALSRGWTTGLRYLVKAENPDEARLETDVCEAIAGWLWREGVMGPGRAALLGGMGMPPSATATPTRPLPILYARPERPLPPRALTLAVQHGQFDMVQLLMREYGLAPDLATLRALERVGRRRGRKRAREGKEAREVEGGLRLQGREGIRLGRG